MRWMCPAPLTPWSLRHLEWYHDHARIESLFFAGALDPTGGAVGLGSGAPGLGLTLREADVDQFRIR